MAHFISFVRIPALTIRQYIWPLPRLGVLEEDRLRLRVWPNDIDFNFHLNNARYLSLMDYGRVHMMARAGLLSHVVRSRWTALVGAVWITYRRSLQLFAGYELRTRIVCWDERWFYFEQIFESRDGLAAVGWVKGVLRDSSGTVSPRVVLERIAPGIESPPMPETIAAWNEITRDKLKNGAS